MNIETLITEYGKTFFYFLAVLPGAVQFIKVKVGIEGNKVELLAVLLYVACAVISILPYYFPGWGTDVAAVALFILTGALAAPGYYKFVAARWPKTES